MGGAWRSVGAVDAVGAASASTAGLHGDGRGTAMIATAAAGVRRASAQGAALRCAAMPRPWPTPPPTAAHRAAYAEAAPRSYWLDDLPARAPAAPLTGVADADL